MYKRRSVLAGIALVSGLAVSKANPLAAKAKGSSTTVADGRFSCSNIVVPTQSLKHVPSWLYHVDLSKTQIEQIIAINQRFQQPLAERKAVAQKRSTALQQKELKSNAKAALQQKHALNQAKHQVVNVLDQKRTALCAVLTSRQRLIAAQSILSRRNHEHLLSVVMPKGKKLAII